MADSIRLHNITIFISVVVKCKKNATIPIMGIKQLVNILGNTCLHVVAKR